MFYSIIVPVYNRPQEVEELVDSLCLQTYTKFEVIIVEDGSSTRCESVINSYRDKLDIKYFYKENGGPGSARNYGAEKSQGDYLIILDSDCIAPENYLQAIEKRLSLTPLDAFGGADAAHESFTSTQKAINYSMTSFFTTGGIRGGKKKMDRFYPRSFNMGIKREVYHKLGGFAKMRFGEDIDFSIRIFEAGYHCELIEDAWVYHKRRSTLKQFFKQVHNSGIARINLYKRYPSSLKLVHTLPALFTCGVIFLLFTFYFLWWAFILPLLLYALIVFIDSTIQNKNIRIGIISIATSYVQLIGYGTGFLRAFWRRCILKKDEFEAFKDSFYK